MAPVNLWLYRALLWLGLPLVVPWLLLRDRLTGKRRPRFADRMGRRLPELAPGGAWDGRPSTYGAVAVRLRWRGAAG